ncbi:LutC/YkgG family protein [Paraburkholderia unamae]|uniref:L-lactate dehydrogenase complex protein LldG n=1 Tax=Paraburkholderia unamae TaxID=219649 RepID=A0ABX5K8D6_9BURK|nr:LUD domain-containing protein [Paraburkholderia unamae]PVX70729.1 L-lactate dehydrogenase complex protein LldG [Paraburkholderia unamae]
MSSREAILSRLREVERAARPLPTVPLYDIPPEAVLDTFKTSLARLGGVWCEPPADGDLDAFIRTRFASARVICSATPEVRGTRDLATIARPHDLEDVDVGVVRPAFAVAETGSIWLSEHEYRVNALGYLPQHLVALLDPDQIVSNLHHAYRRREFFESRYAVLMSGPSATADIEGVLIRGAQGIRSLTIVPVRQPRAAS